MTKDTENESSWPLLIPISVLVIVALFTQVIWIAIPIFVLVCVFLGSFREDQKISAKREEYYTPTSVTTSQPPIQRADRKPIYDRKKQKDEGIAFGTLIPIAILGYFFITSLSWFWLIPIFFLVWSFFESVLKNLRGRSDVREEIQKGEVESIQDIADRTGMPEEQVRRHIVRDKRGGTTDIWFDPSTGRRATRPTTQEQSPVTTYGCKYCGFALRSEDRFCPYCGAPIKAEN